MFKFEDLIACVFLIIIVIIFVFIMDVATATNETDSGVIDRVGIGNYCRVYAQSETRTYEIEIDCKQAYYFSVGDEVIVSYEKGRILGIERHFLVARSK